MFFFFSLSLCFLFSNSYFLRSSACSIRYASRCSAVLTSSKCFCYSLIILSSSSSNTSILAASSVFPHRTERMGSTSLSNIKSSLSSTKVFASHPLFIGIDLGVGYIYIFKIKILYRSFNNEISLTSNFIFRCLISKFLYKLISLNINILSASLWIGCLNFSIEKLISRCFLLFKLSITVYIVTFVLLVCLFVLFYFPVPENNASG